VLGYFILDEALHLLLDIGFVWTIYLDGEMGLLPASVALHELQVEAELRQAITAEADLLQSTGLPVAGLTQITPAPVQGEIVEVSFFEHGEARCLKLIGKDGSLKIQTDLNTGTIAVSSQLGD
jgi:hypothetical protein